MRTFTCITEVRESSHLTQHTSEHPIAALREHIGALPYDDGTDPDDPEIEWLRQVSEGESDVKLQPVEHCRNTWMWLDGALHRPSYATYVVKTDTA